MRVIPGNAQDIGDRSNQEDSFGFSSLGDRAFERHGGVMMVLCDGMGGLANGAAASRTAVDAALRGYRRKLPSEDVPGALNRTVREAHQAVCAIFGNGETAGSTIVVAVVLRSRLYWASLGDSRLYLFRDGDSPRQLTQDHNVANLDHREARGECPPGEVLSTANPEALTAYLGSPYPPKPDIGRDGLQLRRGDRIVACSDGVYRGLSPDAMATIALRGDPLVAAEHMIQSVLGQRLPHQDNLTVVLFAVSPQGRLAELIALRGPAVPVVLYGAAGGFCAGAIVVLLIMGILNLPWAGRPAVAPMPRHQTLGDFVSPRTSDQPVATPPAEAQPAAGNEQSTPAETTPAKAPSADEQKPPKYYLEQQQSEPTKGQQAKKSTVTPGGKPSPPSSQAPGTGGASDGTVPPKPQQSSPGSASVPATPTQPQKQDPGAAPAAGPHAPGEGGQ